VLRRWMNLLVIGLVLLCVPVTVVAEDAPSEHGTSHAEEGPDLGHANAGDQLEDPEEIKADLAIYTFVVFILLLAILGKFAWGPVMEGLARREQGIADQIESARVSAAEAKTLLAEHRKQLDGAAVEIRALFEQGQKDADRQKQEIIDGAQKVAQSEKDRAIREIAAAKGDALSQLAQQSVDTAVTLAGNIVGQQLKASDHARLIDESLGQFASRN